MLRAYAAMLPRLLAEESLRRVSESLAASGDVKPDYRQGLLDAWRREAEGKAERPGDKPAISKAEYKRRLMGMGIVLAKPN